MTTYKPKYSGPGNSGICKCGHSWEDHHLSIVMNEQYYKETNEVYVPEECEFYGCNEQGGKMPDEDTGMWVEHCRRYIDRGYPRNVDRGGE